jgi:hypothetical protein
MLGIRLSADGQDPEEVQFRKDQARNWVKNMRAAHLPKHLAWKNLRAILYAQIRYPMKAVTFTEQQWLDIMEDAIRTGIQTSGFVKTLPFSLVFGPAKYGGGGLFNPYVYQGIHQLKALVDHGYNLPDPTGKLMHCEAQSVLLELGTGDALLSHDLQKYGKISTDCWMKCAWQFTQRYNIQLYTDLSPVKLQCPGDKFLIPEFARLYPECLAILNNCCKYLQVSSLAEIVTANGQYITECAWMGQRDELWPPKID